MGLGCFVGADVPSVISLAVFYVICTIQAVCSFD